MGLKHSIAPWARPLLEELAATHGSTPADVLLVGTLAPAVSFARVSNTSRADFLWWGTTAWDKAWNYLPTLDAPKATGIAYPTQHLSAAQEACADDLVVTISDRRSMWERAGSEWGAQVGTAQVAAVLILFAGRVAHRTDLGFSAWRALLERAWLAGEIYALNVARPEAA